MEQNALLKNGRLQRVTVVSEEEAGSVILRAQVSTPGKFITNQHLVLTQRYLVFGKQHLFTKTHFEEMTWIPLEWIRPESVVAKGRLVKELAFTLADGKFVKFTVNGDAGPSAEVVAGALIAALSK